MRSWLRSSGVSLVVVTSLLSSQVTAQESAPELPPLSVAPCPQADLIRPLELEEGLPGQWLPRETAICMANRLLTFSETVVYVGLLETRLETSDERIEALEHTKDLAVEEAEIAREGLEAALRRAERAERELGAWHRARALWAAVGAVVTIGLTAIAAWVLKEVR